MIIKRGHDGGTVMEALLCGVALIDKTIAHVTC